MSYLLYSEYVSMGGQLEESVFNDLEYEAETYVDWVTFNRLQAENIIPDKVKTCIYHIIKLVALQMDIMGVPVDASNTASATGASIASQSNDGVSISYNTLSASDALELSKKEVDSLIHRYLQGVTNSLGRKLLYRGVYPDE